MSHKPQVGDEVSFRHADFDDANAIGKVVYIGSSVVVEWGRDVTTHYPEDFNSELKKVEKKFKSGFINIFRVTSGIDAGKCFSAQHIYDDYNFAVAQGNLVNNYVDTAKVEWNCEP